MQQRFLFLKVTVGSVIAMINIIVVAGEEAMQPILFGVLEIEAHAALSEVVDMESA